jgi:hypothetical protein
MLWPSPRSIAWLARVSPGSELPLKNAVTSADRSHHHSAAQVGTTDMDLQKVSVTLSQ